MDQEPDGTDSSSVQAQWLKEQLGKSKSRWNIVYDHYPPYSSSTTHGSSAAMRWPFARWGASAVLSGHVHVYERVMHDGIPYFTDGVGGAPRYAFGHAIPGSAVRFAASWGAQRVTVDGDAMRFDFFTREGKLIDSYRVGANRR